LGISLTRKYNWNLRSICWLFDNGAKGDNFEGFKILYWLNDLHNGTGVFIAEADDTTKVFDHGGNFIKSEM